MPAHINRLAMDYNQLKVLVLRVLAEKGSAESSAVAAALATVTGVNLDIHAIRMALMRYYKQGLLCRERKFGVYTYELSERGIHRLAWLDSTDRERASGTD